MAETLDPLQADDASFAAGLRAWRRARGVSQFDLAMTVGVSPRHLSFLETGRAKPSRDMALAICDGLTLPRGAKNAMLTRAGFAAVYPATPLAGAALEPFRRILADMMDKHAPFPAMVLDRHWTIQDANASARLLLSPLQGQNGDMNVIRMLTESPLAPQLLANFAEVLLEMAGRVRLEALESGPDPVNEAHLKALDAAMRRFPAKNPAAPRRPLVPLMVRTPSATLSFLSAVAHFGTSEDVTVRDLRLELLFPADDATRAAMQALAG